MKKVLLFVGLLLIVLVMLSMNVQEGMNFDGPDKKQELIKNLIELRDKNSNEIQNSEYLTPEFKGKQIDEMSSFLNNISTAKIGTMKDSANFVVEVRKALRDTINNNKNNSNSTKVNEDTTMSTAQTKLGNKADNN